ncbi:MULTISPECIES: anthranilate phosphoribosyltransferase [Bradyrhizobium]|uniref:anthranilate phosphoribosyltransferase n=1 Tax=Bradyrhizobium TaxID=374 RepID=UPI000841EBE5|nr:MULTISPECIES: anthranilate phosphoribosyltransferase [Bradyrhizobium]MCP1838226.1 anthranilate phosphoribosyltransferase [Bradyrhizobium sp. USDA 4538]MCP1898789.1 anthranilate phosphoribosyltransferase [Bradyrhizobium sp. USDA 4537]MCP1909289.1 anthranilate phosphoribosyltransferase [Bradyrhizobium elkanii]MCP1987099.1 anthranilate phosphoribosyltransferase [Bradyrhizobium sp. USDA 4539]ODM72124.1 anthranilate phosphoribosyltransferase [Bradyrhizobium elkanii]
MEALKSIIGKVASGATLSREESAFAFDGVMSGRASPSQIGGLLMGLRVRGETVEEITGAASAMRKRMPSVEAGCDPIYIASTNDTSLCAVNVWTCASFIVAGAGVAVAKHTNCAASLGSGNTADVLARIGVKIDLEPDAVMRCVRDAGIGFTFASAHYPAMQRVAQIRTALGTHTIFNLIGPLSNPARLKRQVVGVCSREWVQPLAYVLKNLGAESVWVVHGSGGLDDITLAEPTFVSALEAGTVRTFEVRPEEAGFPRGLSKALDSGDPDNLALQSILDGAPGRIRDASLFTAATALIVAGRASTLQEGVAIGRESLDRGAAAARLKHLIAVSNA